MLGAMKSACTQCFNMYMQRYVQALAHTMFKAIGICTEEAIQKSWPQTYTLTHVDPVSLPPICTNKNSLKPQTCFTHLHLKLKTSPV